MGYAHSVPGLQPPALPLSNSVLWLLVVVAVLGFALWRARPKAAAKQATPHEPAICPTCGASRPSSAVDETTAVVGPAVLEDEEIGIPRSIVEQLSEQLKRLDVLERRERLRLVRREERHAFKR